MDPVALPSTAMQRIHKLDRTPNVEAYSSALSQPFVKDLHKRILVAHKNTQNQLAGAPELAAHFGRRHPFINLHYGRLGRLVAEFLDLRLPVYSRGPLWTTALAAGGIMGRRKLWYWQLYPEVSKAIDTLGWRFAEE